MSRFIIKGKRTLVAKTPNSNTVLGQDIMGGGGGNQPSIPVPVLDDEEMEPEKI